MESDLGHRHRWAIMTVPETSFAVDAYLGMNLPTPASVGKLAAGWTQNLTKRPLPAPASSTILREVGILTTANISQGPCLYEPPKKARFSPMMKVRSLTAV